MFLGLFLWCSYSSAQDFLKARDFRIVNAQGENILLRGMGLGGHMLQEGYMLKVPFSGQQYVFEQHVQDLIGLQRTEEFYSAWRANHTQKRDIDSLKSWGFNSVRLPMHYNLYTLPIEKEPMPGKQTWLKEGFRLTDSLISWCRANDMYLILDMHATPGGQGNDVNISDRDPEKPALWESEANQDKLVALWEELARRYKDEPVVAAYDLINEPNWAFEKGKNKNGLEDSLNIPLKNILVRLTNAVRKIDKNHMIIIEGNGWGNNYNGMLPPWDDNMVLSFHKYWNNNDKTSIAWILHLREKYNIPIWLGESGENSNVWYHDAISLMEENNIGWCWWPLKKLGFNNPLEIKVGAGYQNLLDFWGGKAKKPSADEAYKALMQLAENTKIQNCTYHKEVVDAMIRQPKDSTAMAFNLSTLKDSLIIRTVDYDMGTQGVAYNDTDVANYYISTGGERQSWNLGHTYRNDGVDIFEQVQTNSGTTFFVGELKQGEWLNYTLNVETTGDYFISLKAKNLKNTAEAVVSSSGGKTPIEFNNYISDWYWTTPLEIHLEQGKNTLKLEVISAGFDVEKIRLIKVEI